MDKTTKVLVLLFILSISGIAHATEFGGGSVGGGNASDITQGTLPAAQVDGTSITKQGNTFGGANQIPILDANGLLPNVDVDGTSVTKQGNTFGGANQLIRLDSNAALAVASVSVSGQALFGVSGGSVGVRNSTPDVPLHVLQSGTASTIFGGDTVAAFQNTGVAENNARISIMSGSNAAAILQLGDTDSEAIGRVQYRNNTDSLEFHVNGLERVYINSAGRVGVNIANPVTLLDVEGNASFGNVATKSTFTAAGVLGMGAGISLFAVASPTATTPSATKLMVYDSVDNKVCVSTGTALGAWKCVELSVNLSASTETKTGGLNVIGAIGAGVTDPTSPLDVRTNPGAEGITIRGRQVDGTSGLIFKNFAGDTNVGTFQVNASTFIFGSVANAPMDFYTNNAEKMRLTTLGKLGILNIAPNYVLDVTGDINSTSSATFTTPAHGEGVVIKGRSSDQVAGLIFKNNAGTTTQGTFQVDANSFLFGSVSNASMNFYTNNAEKMVLNTDGTLKLFQNTACENQTPSAVGVFCAQNSATCPVAVSTGTALAAYACITFGAP